MPTLKFLRSHLSRGLGRSLLTISLSMMWFFCLTSVAQAQSAEPVWRHAWQQPLVDYVKSLTPEDVKTGPMKVDASWFEANDQHLERYRFLISGYTPLLPFVGQLASFSAEDFMWSHVWRSELPINQGFLKDARLNVSQGQLWVPAHPTAACLYAWAYHENQGWNPYANNKAMACRAAVTGIAALLGWALDDDYFNDPASSYTGTRWGVHGFCPSPLTTPRTISMV